MCDCDATPEELTAGIHGTPCTSRDAEPDNPSDHYDKPRILAHWNATRHGWTRFQASNRRTAERLAHKPLDNDTA
ncbi:hypothetical protein ACIRNU_34865 [Streptomyces rochei]|uniref:hypothetical protein n=1 Tax=Streptomyces rochei TaxID=1928 RepID=UPI00381FB7D0